MNKSSTSNENKNNSKKLKWFMTTIQELRQEIQDINFSKTLLDKQNYGNDLTAVRKDIEVLRRDMEATKAEISKINQDVQMLVQDKDEREVRLFKIGFRISEKVMYIQDLILYWFDNFDTNILHDSFLLGVKRITLE